jgi:signal transduction histidine kinase/ActR/RegA family two-component response regulator
VLGIKSGSAHKTTDLPLNSMRTNDGAAFIPNLMTEDIFENTFAFFGTLSSEGFVLSLKGKVFERTETDPQLLIGQRFSETVYWQSSEFTSSILEKAIEEAAGGQKSKTLLDFRINSEEKLIIELFLYPLEDKKDRQIFFCAHDVTTREKEIEFYRRRAEHLLYAAENADIGLWFWDLVEEKIFSTPKCNELFEVPPNEPITLLSISDIIHPEDSEQVEAAITESQTYGKDYESEFRVIYSDGSVHWITTKGKTYLDAEGKPFSMMGVVRGITEKKAASEELSKIYESEKKARDEAEEANRTKDSFLAIVSHELRSPLNAILGWTKILLTKNVDAETQRNALETIERSARSQAKLIEDLVDSARIASGKLRLEFRPTNLYEVVKNVCNFQKPAAEAKEIALELNADRTKIYVFGDMVRLQQIFTNIVTNSIKFTPEGGEVKINMSVNKGKVTVSVKDNGQGISAEVLPTIFRQFAQGDEKTSDRSGLGLGLSISKILIEKHNGTIRAESEGTGQGSEFTVELPLTLTEDEISAEIKVSNPNDEKHLKDIKILMVEDDPDSRQVLQLVLEQSGANVKSVGSAKEALTTLTALAEDLPDVIVSDLAMPVEDGYSLINQIRKLPETEGGKIPAIALSAFVAGENKERAYNSGFQKYHTKPFDPDGLIEDILHVLDKSNLE